MEQQLLVASDGMPGDQFGFAVAIDLDTIAVGAVFDTNDEGDLKHGSVYIFSRNDGVWMETQKLIASDAADGDWFGMAVDMQGDTMVVGAKYVGYGFGAAYVFMQLQGGLWSEMQKLSTGPTSETNDHFGEDIAIDGQTIVVGELYSNANRGVAYVYIKDNDGIWILQAQLLPLD